MAIYLQLGDIKGNVTAAGYEEYINIMSVSFGVNRQVNMESGAMANRERSAPNLSTIMLSKEADSSVTALFKAATTGAAGNEATLKFVRTSADELQEFMSIVLTDCIVSGYNVSAGAEGAPMENIELSYSKIEVSFTDYDKSNKGGSPTRASYDLTTAKAG